MQYAAAKAKADSRHRPRSANRNRILAPRSPKSLALARHAIVHASPRRRFFSEDAQNGEIVSRDHPCPDLVPRNLRLATVDYADSRLPRKVGIRAAFRGGFPRREIRGNQHRERESRETRETTDPAAPQRRLTWAEKVLLAGGVTSPAVKSD